MRTSSICVTFPKTEMGAGVVAALIARAGIDEALPGTIAGLHLDDGAVGIALERGIDRPHQQPMPLPRRHVAIQPRRSGRGGDQQVQIAVVVDIARAK